MEFEEEGKQLVAKVLTADKKLNELEVDAVQSTEGNKFKSANSLNSTATYLRDFPFLPRSRKRLFQNGTLWLLLLASYIHLIHMYECIICTATYIIRLPNI